jgi:hypothetical protein
MVKASKYYAMHARLSTTLCIMHTFEARRHLMPFSKLFDCSTVGPIGQKALNKVVSHTDTTLTLPDATRRYQTLPDITRRYQMLTDIIKLSNPTVFFTN